MQKNKNKKIKDTVSLKNKVFLEVVIVSRILDLFLLGVTSFLFVKITYDNLLNPLLVYYTSAESTVLFAVIVATDAALTIFEDWQYFLRRQSNRQTNGGVFEIHKYEAVFEIYVKRQGILIH